MTETVELDITALAAGGDAVGRDAGGRVTFVGGGAPGDRVRVRITERHRSFARAELVEVIAASSVRVVPPCPLAAARRCGGCPWMHVAAAAQLAAKQELASSALRRLIAGGLELTAPVAAAPPLRWRRRARLHWDRRADEPGAALGFLAPRSHQVVDVPACLQLDDRLERALIELRAGLAPALHGRGELHLVVGHLDQVHLVIDRSDGGLCGDDEAAAMLGRAGIAGVVLVPDRRTRRVWGAAAIELEPGLLGAADAFAQASAEGNQALIAATVTAVAPAPGQRILELFAGAGNFTRRLVAAGAAVVANDVVAPPALPAEVRFEPGRAEDAVARLAAAGERFDAVLLDPPRTGARDAVLALAGLPARRLVYVSCDPATLARDLELLAAAGWAPRCATVLDLMPQTAHLEIVAVAERP